MRVLHVISSGGMYGAEAVILNLSRALEESGHSSSIGVFANLPHPNLQLYDAGRREGIPSYRIECRGQIDPSVLRSIRSLAQEVRADIVHAHGYKADLYTWLALRNDGTPFVSTCHNWLDDGLLVRLYGRLDRVALRNYSAVVAVSEPVKQRLAKAGVNSERLFKISNGIDLHPFRRAMPILPEELQTESAQIVGIVGRLSPEKGIDLFLRAAGRVLADQPNTKFIVVGDGPDQDQLCRLTRELRLEGKVCFLGRRSDMPEILASLDVLVLSSRFEGMPMTVLEGMASSRAIIATAVGEVPSVVHDGVTGLLIPPEDVDALHKALTRLLRNPSERECLGERGKAFVEKCFSAKQMADEYLAVYQGVLSGTAGRGVLQTRSQVSSDRATR